MDARIVVEAAQATAGVAEVRIILITKIDLLVTMLTSQFNPATILAPLLHMGNSVTAVAPDSNFSGGVSALAVA